jgi:glutamate--cysteine ligase
LPDATCLRMGDLGYRSAAQRQMSVCFNTLDSYINTLKEGITQPYGDYERIGLQKNGEYQQLSTSLLQIENEFYGSIRPKRVTQSGEVPLAALKRDGIEYIEVRCLDVNPYHPLGVDAETLDFIDSFLLFCILSESPQCDDDDRSRLSDNMQKIVNHGRDPQLMLQHDDALVSLKQWADECMQKIRACAELLDSIDGCDRYVRAWTAQQAKIADVNLTPSARMLKEIQQLGGYYEFALAKSTEHAQQFRARPLAAEDQQRYLALAKTSLEKQAQIEAADTLDFDTYLKKFFAQYELL